MKNIFITNSNRLWTSSRKRYYYSLSRRRKKPRLYISL